VLHIDRFTGSVAEVYEEEKGKATERERKGSEEEGMGDGEERSTRPTAPRDSLGSLQQKSFLLLCSVVGRVTDRNMHVI